MKYLLLLLIPLGILSCSEAKMLSKSLSKYKAPLNYLHDTEKIECDKSKKLTLSQIDNTVLDTFTTVSKINYKIIPLIIYNYDEMNLAVRMGQNSLEQDYNSFFKSAFDEESKRTGCYSVIDDSQDSEYTLEIVFDTCSVNSKYQRNSTTLFFLVAYMMYYNEIGFPAEASIDLKAILRKDQNLVFEKTYSIKKEQPFVSPHQKNINSLRSDFVVNMAESLSLGTKECIESIIRDVNKAIQK